MGSAHGARGRPGCRVPGARGPGPLRAAGSAWGPSAASYSGGWRCAVLARAGFTRCGRGGRGGAGRGGAGRGEGRRREEGRKGRGEEETIPRARRVPCEPTAWVTRSPPRRPRPWRIPGEVERSLSKQSCGEGRSHQTPGRFHAHPVCPPPHPTAHPSRSLRSQTPPGPRRRSASRKQLYGEPQ